MLIEVNVLTDIKDVVEQFTTFVNKLIPDSVIPIIIQLIATAVLLIVITKLAFKPVRKILATRKEYIANQIKDAEQSKIKAAEYEETAKASIGEARKQAATIISDAKMQSQAASDRAREELAKEIADQKLRAEKEIESAKQAAAEDVRKQIVDVALQASEVVLNREVNEKDNSRLVDDFVKDIVN